MLREPKLSIRTEVPSDRRRVVTLGAAEARAIDQGPRRVETDVGAIRIGDVLVPGRVTLAPLAGVTDLPFRLLCKEYGAAMMTTEMVTAEGLARGCRRTAAYVRFDDRERPIAVQLYGSDPDRIAEAARIAVDVAEPDFIDLNFGCPVRKIVSKGAGSACLREPERLGEILHRTVSAVSVPVTAKIRSGWDRPIAPRIVEIAEAAGVAALTVHGRTRDQGYAGEADWAVVRDCVAAARTIRIIGNGDVKSASEALERLASTGCDLVMIGRGAMGRPWIFRQARHLLETGERLPEPPLSERLRVCLRHYELSLAIHGRRRAVFEMRPHVGWYARGMPGSAALRAEIMGERDPDRVLARLADAAERCADAEACGPHAPPAR